jgi:hypothetical protein
MLNITKHPSKIQSLNAPPMEQATGEVINGLFLAKAWREYPVWRRALDAVRWTRGEVTVAPTAKQACAIFRVSYPRLKRAEAILAEQRERVECIKCERTLLNGNGPTTLSDSVLDNLVSRVGVARVLAAVNRATRPHSVAAE